MSNKPRLPMNNTKGDPNTSVLKDRCGTPPDAVIPLLPYLPKDSLIWESACGDYSLVSALQAHGYSNIIATDILTNYNFFHDHPNGNWIQVTNPPYSDPTKTDWFRRSYELERPFALLVPVSTTGGSGVQWWFKRKGIGIIFINYRINFIMSNLGLKGSGAHFATAWFTHGLGIDGQMIWHERKGEVNAMQPSLFDLENNAT